MEGGKSFRALGHRAKLFGKTGLPECNSRKRVRTHQGKQACPVSSTLRTSAWAQSNAQTRRERLGWARRRLVDMSQSRTAQTEGRSRRKGEG